MVFEHHFKEVAFFVLRTSVPFLPLRWSDSKAFMLSDSVYLCWLCPLYCQLYLTCCNIKILILRLTQVLVWSQSGCLFSQHRICYLNTVSCGRMSYCTLTLPAATTKYAQYHQRHTAMVNNIRCCLSIFQVARPHTVYCIKENIHLKVDFENILGGEQRGVCWFKSV